MYPDDSIQSLCNSWWVENDSKDFHRGSLIRGFLPHVDQTPSEYVLTGRSDPKEHRSAKSEIKPLRLHEVRSGKRNRGSLPVAALPNYDDEIYGVFRSKMRPAVIISTSGYDVPDELRRGKPKYQTSPNVLVIPAYGTDPDGKRAGFTQALIDRIRKCEYPQYFWDIVPGPKPTNSIFRLDHIQPLGRHHDAIEFMGYSLSEEALSVVDEWLEWFVRGKLPADSTFASIREDLIVS